MFLPVICQSLSAINLGFQSDSCAFNLYTTVYKGFCNKQIDKYQLNSINEVDGGNVIDENGVVSKANVRVSKFGTRYLILRARLTFAKSEQDFNIALICIILIWVIIFGLKQIYRAML